MIIKKIKREVLRFLFGSFSFTSLMFAFQACYGIPENFYSIQGQVISATDGKPIEGIQVYNNYYGKQSATYTSDSGLFWIDVDNNSESVTICLRDVDEDTNGYYANLDTLVKTADLSDTLIIKLQENSANQETK